MKNNDTTTLCISNGGQRAINEMNIINDSVNKKVSAEKPATSHTLDDKCYIVQYKT